MLRKIRITLALLFFTAITLLVLDFTGTLHHYLSWMAEVQLLPAILATNLVIVGVILMVTLLMGRIYCSVICPLGVYQDGIAWGWTRFRKKNNRKYRHVENPRAHNIIRCVFLVAFVVLALCGLMGIASLIAPYSSYVRMVQTLLQPLYIMGNNLLAYFAESIDSYAFYSVDVWMRSAATFFVSLITWCIITLMAARRGRLYCNTICPVGTLLGFLSKFAWLKPRVKADKCIHCGLCERGCKAKAIKVTKEGVSIDYSRCVDCFNCLDICQHEAFVFRPYSKGLDSIADNQAASAVSCGSPARTDEGADSLAGKPQGTVDTSRRAFLTGVIAAGTGAALAQQQEGLHGGFAVIEDKVIPARQTPILPPGAGSANHFAKSCTACQLCVSECPNGVLRPSSDALHFMQPVMSYERGYCREECHRCSDVCPTDALHLADSAEKVSTKIGTAHWVKKNCIPITDGVECGNCARHCPTGAIEMIPIDEKDEDSPYIPMVNETRCIGCGACENLCPSRPLSAIIVEGIEQQHTI